MALTNKLKPQVDIPVWEWCRLAPAVSSSTSSTAAADNSIYHVSHGRYIYYMQAGSTSAAGQGTGFFRYDTITDAYQQLAYPPIAAGSYTGMQFVGGHGYFGRVISAGSSTIQTAAISGQTLKGFDIRIQSGTGMGQHRVITGVSDVVIADSGTVTAVTVSPQLLMTDVNKNWAINQWVGYQVRFVGNTGNSQVRKIIYNTPNTLVFADTNKYAEEQFAYSPVLALGPMALFAIGTFYQIESSILTVDTPWLVQPDSTTKYVVHSGGIWMINSGTNYTMEYYDIAADTWYVRNSGNATSPVQLFPSAGNGDVTLMNTGEVALIEDRGGTAGGGSSSTVSATSTTLQDTSKSWAVNALSAANLKIRIFSGTGLGQARTISSNTSNTITVANPWTVTPDSTSMYVIDSLDDGNVTAAGNATQTGLGTGTIFGNTLNVTAVTSGSFYPGQTVYGTGVQTSYAWVSLSGACFSTASSGLIVTLSEGTTLGPVQYTSAAGATSSGSTITVGSTAGLAVGMIVVVTIGTGAFTFGTTVTAINSATTFTTSASPSSVLSGGANVVTGQFGVIPGMTVSLVPGTGTGALAVPTTVSSATLNTITLSTAPTTQLANATVQCANVWTSGSIATASNGNLVTVPNTTAFPGTTGLYPGMLVTMVSGTGTITAGTYVESILDSTHFYLSTNPTVAIAVAAFITAVPYQTIISNQISGTPGGVGTYAIWPGQTVASTSITAVGTATLTDSSKTWPLNRWNGQMVRIISGTGVGQTRSILNTVTAVAAGTVGYTSVAGATSSGTTITVTSTANLVLGMTLAVTAGTGAFIFGTTVATIINSTSFTCSVAPSTPLSGGSTVITGTVGYTSNAGATSSGTTITVNSTAGLVVGMMLNVTSGTGAFAYNTTVLAITGGTTFTCSVAPTTALSASAVVTGTSNNTLTVYPNWVTTPDTTSVYVIHGDSDKLYFSIGGVNAAAATSGQSATFIHNVDSDLVTMGRMLDYGVARGVSAQFGDQIPVAISSGVPVSPITYMFGAGATWVSAASAATSSGAVVTLSAGSTIGLTPGMPLTVAGGTGTFAANTYVLCINSATVFTLSATPSVALGGANVVTQTAAALAYFSPGPFATATLSGTGTTATATFSSAVAGSFWSGTASSYVIPVGSLITITNALPVGYNGTFTVTASSGGSVSFANATSGSQTQVGTISIGSQLNLAASMFTVVGAVPTGYNAASQTILSAGAGFLAYTNATVGEMTVQGFLQQLPIATTSLTISSTTATLATPGTTFSVGSWISVTGSTTVAGGSGSYNGVYQVATSGAGTCTYSIPTNTPTGTASIQGSVQLATTTQLITTVNNHHFKSGMTISHKGDTHFANTATNIAATITPLVPVTLTTPANQYVYSTGSNYAGTQIVFPQATTMLTDAAKNWIPNQWAGCLVSWNSTQGNGAGTNSTILSAFVLANTSTQLIFPAIHTAAFQGISRYVITQPSTNPGHAVLGGSDSGLALGNNSATQIQDITKFWAMAPNVSSAAAAAASGTNTFTLASVNGIVPGMTAAITTNTAGNLTLPAGTTVSSVSPSALTVTLSQNTAGSTGGNTTFTFAATANSSGNTVTLAGWNTQFLGVGMYLGVNSIDNIKNVSGGQVVVAVDGAFVPNGGTTLTPVYVTAVLNATQFTVSAAPSVPLLNANIFASSWFTSQWNGRKIRYMTGVNTNFLENAFNVAITSTTTGGVVGFATLGQTPVSGVTVYAILQQPIRGTGTNLMWNFGQSDFSRRGSYIVQARGNNLTGFDRMNFQNGDVWEFLTPTPNFEGLTQGAMYAYDGGDRIYYTPQVTQRLYYLDLDKMQIHGGSQYPYAVGTAIYGNRMEIFSTVDGLKYVWLNRHSFQECFKQLLFY